MKKPHKSGTTDVYPTVRQHFIEIMVSTLATASVAMETTERCICNTMYGEPIVKDATAVLFQELPYRDTFMPDTVEQITIPYGHHFCILCIGKWFYAKQTCPMCRQSVDVPGLSEEFQNGHLSTRIEGFMQVYQVSEWRAREVCNIHRLSMRQLLTTPQRMPVGLAASEYGVQSSQSDSHDCATLPLRVDWASRAFRPVNAQAVLRQGRLRWFPEIHKHSSNQLVQMHRLLDILTHTMYTSLCATESLISCLQGLVIKREY
jgi:hypothetical protein